MMRTKKELRARLKAGRLAMSDSQVSTYSRKIGERLIESVDWSKIKRVHIYQSVAAWNEVDTKELARGINQKNPKIKVNFASLDRYAPFPNEKFDLIIVPVLGFDKSNYRLGLGGGWYDRFLAAQPQALKIGLAYRDGFIKDGLPHEPHDVPLDRVITEV